MEHDSKNCRRVKVTVGLFHIAVLLSVFGCSPVKISVNSSQSTAPTDTSHAVDDKPPVTIYRQQIRDIAGGSSCAQTNWADRGRSPGGYIKGMALSFARSLCRIRIAEPPHPASSILKSVNSLDATKDVLAHYQDILTDIGIAASVTGQQPLQATYTIGLGLGMMESSGKYCEGWDIAAGADRESYEAEAGLFQASYDSANTSNELQKLYDEYYKNPKRCLLETYKEAVVCRPANILGTGAGATFQEFTKRCPAFATEYAMALIRIRRTHFGPLNRKTAQVVPECNVMLNAVRQVVNQNPELACRELF